VSNRVWRRRLIKPVLDERGQGLMEYTMILVLIAVACAGAATSLGQQIVATLYEPVVTLFG
jgi:Flp pilus assembly pilin Flp